MKPNLDEVWLKGYHVVSRFEPISRFDWELNWELTAVEVKPQIVTQVDQSVVLTRDMDIVPLHISSLSLSELSSVVAMNLTLELREL